MVGKLDREDSSMYEKHRCVTRRGEYQNMRKYEVDFLVNDTARFKSQRNVDMCSYENLGYDRTIPFNVFSKGRRKDTPSSNLIKKNKFLKSKESVYANTSGLQHEQRSGHVYANAQTKNKTKHLIVEGTKEQEHLLQNYQTRGASPNGEVIGPERRNSRFLAELNDPKLDVIYC